MNKITLGGGCFWCIEEMFRRLKGVKKVVSGYSGGKKEQADYKTVCSGSTKHIEVVQVDYDEKVIDTENLIKGFFYMHDPTQLNRQGNDIGYQYKSSIFYHSDEQKEIAEKVIKELNPLYNNKIQTELFKYENFYPAEKYHQNYYEINPEQSYCKMVIAPKLQKFKKQFLDKYNQFYKSTITMKMNSLFLSGVIIYSFYWVFSLKNCKALFWLIF